MADADVLDWLLDSDPSIRWGQAVGFRVCHESVSLDRFTACKRWTKGREVIEKLVAPAAESLPLRGRG